MSLQARGRGISQQHKATRLAKGVAIACHRTLPPCFGPATSLHCPSSVLQRDGICSPLHAPSPARRQTSSHLPAPCLPAVIYSTVFPPLYLCTFIPLHLSTVWSVCSLRGRAYPFGGVLVA